MPTSCFYAYKIETTWDPEPPITLPDIRILSGGAWKACTNGYILSGGAWKDINGGYVVKSSAWKDGA